jgi:hypothetical protein
VYEKSFDFYVTNSNTFHNTYGHLVSLMFEDCHSFTKVKVPDITQKHLLMYQDRYSWRRENIVGTISLFNDLTLVIKLYI